MINKIIYTTNHVSVELSRHARLEEESSADAAQVSARRRRQLADRSAINNAKKMVTSQSTINREDGDRSLSQDVRRSRDRKSWKWDESASGDNCPGCRSASAEEGSIDSMCEVEK